MINRFAVAMALALVAGNAWAGYTLDPYDVVDAGLEIGALAIGDVTGDGRDDVIAVAPVTDGPSTVLVFVQSATGSLEAPMPLVYGTGGYSTGLVLADFNRDGVLDIIVGTSTGISVISRSGRVPLTFATRQFSGESVAGTGWASGADLAVMDLNRDGAQDVIAQSDWKDTVIYFGDGRGGVRSRAGVATQVSEEGYNDLHLGDFNGDGLSDMAVSGPFDTLRIFYNNGRSGFTTPPVPQGEVGQAWATAVGDFNHDGRTDLVGTHEVNPGTNPPYAMNLFLQTATGTFAAPVALPSVAAAWSALGTDLDGDGMDDLVLMHEGNGGSSGLSYFLQGPDGLGAQQWQPQPSGGLDYDHDIAAGDINGDGCKDVVTSNFLGQALFVFHGRGCILHPDMSVGLAASRSLVTAAIANAAGTESINSPLVRLNLSVGSGTLATGSLPAGCVIQAQTVASQRIECLLDTLAPGTTTLLAIPLVLTGTGPRAALTASVHASSDTVETTLANNSASRRVLP